MSERMARQTLLAALEAEASAHALESDKVAKQARTMLKPGEQSTRRQLDVRARSLSGVARACYEAIRSLKASGLQP